MRIATIFVYYLIFIFATLFFVKADRTKKDKKIKAYMICGVVLLSLFACFRGPLVGWDTRDTIILCFDRAKNYRSITSIIANRTRHKEPIYLIISYILLKFTNNSRVFLFVMQLMTIGPIAVVSYKKRDTLSVTIIMVTYMLLFYQQSFNIIRQSVAAAFLFMGCSDLMDRKYVKTGLLFILTCLLHSSGIIGVGLVIALYIFTNNNSLILRVFMVGLAVFVSIIALTVWKTLVLSMIQGGILPDQYSGYVSIMSGEVTSKYNTIQFRNNAIEVLRFFGTIIVVVFLNGKHTGSNNEILFLKYSVVLSFIIHTVVEVGFGVTLGHRITIFIDYLQMALYSYYFPKSVFEDKRFSTGSIIIPKTGIQIVLFYCFFYNFFIYMFVNFGHTLPYQLT